MYKILALLRASTLTAASYRLSWVISIVSLLAAVIPLYFVANALQPIMAESIRSQGEQYFAFVLIGVIAYSFLGSAMDTLPGTIGRGITTGTLESLLGTPTPLPVLLAGLVSYSFCWTLVRGAVLLGAGWFLGARVVWSQVPLGLTIIALIILAYLPFGIIAASLVLAFRTAGPLTRGILTLSVLLGGVYYPTHVIPSWIESLAAAIPLTYGLRALRRIVLEGMPASAVVGDLAILAGFAVILMLVSVTIFQVALRNARRGGTLAQY